MTLDLLREAFSALECVQEQTGSTLLELCEGAEGYRDDDDAERLADLLDRIETEIRKRDGGPTFDVYSSSADGAWVVHVQTDDLECNERGPCPLRVYINDGPGEYLNPPMPADRCEWCDEFTGGNKWGAEGYCNRPECIDERTNAKNGTNLEVNP